MSGMRKGNFVRRYQADNMSGTLSTSGHGTPEVGVKMGNPYPAKPGATASKATGVPVKRVKQAQR
jgi:hypothetical protein